MEELPLELIDKIAEELDDVSLTKLSLTSKLLEDATKYIREKKRVEHSGFYLINFTDENLRLGDMDEVWFYDNFDEVIDKLRPYTNFKLFLVMENNITKKYIIYDVNYITNTIKKIYEGDNQEDLTDFFYTIKPPHDDETNEDYDVAYVLKIKPGDKFIPMGFEWFN